MSPRVAVAVSGGADSLALAWLTRRWTDGVLGVVVDHGIRAGSAAEARWAADTLAGFGVPATILTLAIPPGPALSARARDARTAAIEAWAAERGIVHVLLGHHAADQAETVAMRLLRGSGPAGLAAMPAVREGRAVRWLRPLLATPPGRLRATLRAAGLDWVRDPSNADPGSLRARLRGHRGDPEGDAPSTLRAIESAAARGTARAAAERAAAAWLAAHATVRDDRTVPTDATPPPDVTSAVIRAVGGGRYPPSPDAVARWCAQPRAATLGGVLIAPVRPTGWRFSPEPARARAANAAICPAPFAPTESFSTDGVAGLHNAVGRSMLEVVRRPGSLA